MIKVNTHEAKTRLSALVAQVEKTAEPVIICRNGRPVAELRRISPSNDPLALHPVLSKVIFHESPVQPLESEGRPDSDL